ncbi:hypothetical protein [Nonomuraea glycinis]|uniref:hypothetical protein n=1 Tax=Nonomuraea glycinis TaxID=2047744 RepID=UPI002E10C988|nr:hypothetical protein OHA68_06850 [Nonomuraea glycinis]
MLLITVAPTVVAVLSLGLALAQFLTARRTKQSDREKIVQQAEMLRMAANSAVMNAEMAQLIIRRIEEDDITVKEIQNIARIIRLQMRTLTNELEEERTRLLDRMPKSLHSGMDSSADPTVPDPQP